MPLPSPRPVSDCLAGGGDLGALMRAKDWSATPLGPVETWPESLRTAVSICLNSRFPILLWWGPEMALLYNDAYAALLGAKHPRALGQRGRECWHEIWDIIGPMLRGVVERGEATWSSDQMLPLERNGYREECYFTFSYSPVRDETGTAGVFTAVTETTERVIAERRLRLLRALAEQSTRGRSVRETLDAQVAVLRDAPHDVPFAIVYPLADGVATRGLVAGIAEDHPAAPAELHLDAPSPWPLGQSARTGKPVFVERIPPAMPPIVGAAWPEPVSQALVLPIAEGTETFGFLVVGISPRRAFDEPYRGFLELVAGHIASGIATAKAYETEKKRAEELAALDRAKTDFFSNVSHELRTPLTLILGPLQAALERGVDDGTGEIALAHRNALRLLKLVNTLLDFSRIEAGRIQANYEPTDLGAFTAELASNFRSLVESGGLSLRVDASPGVTAYVDRGMWEKIVFNLLSNAFKFTFEGRIEIATRVTAGKRFELVVRDSGVGIPAAELPRIFERFHRVKNARSRSFEGTGIGLALVHELVRLHGGDIQVVSEEGEGTTFTVSIPLGAAHLPADRVHAEAAPAASQGAAAWIEEASRWISPAAGAVAPTVFVPPRGAAGVVLVVDDNADMRDYTARLLSEEWKVLTTADGMSALEIARRERPDLVVTDVMMPGLDGFGLLRELRADARTRTVPVVMLSARAGTEARIEGIAAGADDYLAKPFSANELRTRVRAHVEASRVRARVAESREHLFSLFMQAPAPICILRGPDHVFELANPPYMALIGRERAVLGRPIREALQELHGQPFFDLLDEVFHTGKRFEGREAPVRLDWGDGEVTERFLNFIYEPIRDAEGNVDGVMVIAFDVTDQVAARQRMDEFLAMLGHELRNPLAAILTSVQLSRMKDGRPSRERDVIERQTRHLGRLVDDLLDVSRITRGKIRLDRHPTEIASVVAVALETAMPLIEARSQRLVIDVPPEGIVVDADLQRLSQAVGNLLTNASKYSDPKGTIRVRAGIEDGQATVSVEDDGMGIPAETLPMLFEPFVQAQHALDRSHGGLGLGLTLVRRLAELHGGTASAFSEGPGKGSRFVVRIPLAKASDLQVAREETPFPAGGRRRVLVVDDNADAAITLADILRARGHEAVTAHDGAAAIAAFRTFPADVVLLDLGLPDADGTEVARRLRGLPGGAEATIVALTGYGQSSDRARTAEAGFDAHLVKPVDAIELASYIESPATHH